MVGWGAYVCEGGRGARQTGRGRDRERTSHEPGIREALSLEDLEGERAPPVRASDRVVHGQRQRSQPHR